MPRVFDDKELLERIDNDWDFLSDTVQMLSTDGRELLKKVQDAVAAGDAAEVGRAAHTLKGMISNFCSPSTHAAALAVEQMGKSGDLSGAPGAVQALGEQIDILVEQLTDFVSTKA